jgi:antitoxin CcdA
MRMVYAHMPDSTPPVARRATNVTLREDLVALAKELEVNISQACEAGLAAQVKAAREKKWLGENREAFEYYNKYVEENGLTLERFRTF